MIKNLVAIHPDTRKLRKRKARKLKPVRPSRKVELHYAYELLILVNKIARETEAELGLIFRSLEPLYTQDASPTDQVKGALTRLAQRFGGLKEFATKLAALMAIQVSGEVDERLSKAIEQSVGVNVKPFFRPDGRGRHARAIKKAVEDNVALITSIPTQYFEKLEASITKFVANGVRHEGLIAEVERLGEVTRNRAKLIARDQVAKLNSNLNSIRQTTLGITEYEWQTAGDERVRENHRSKDGKRFRWDDPPEDTGNPGEDIQCRCVAIPVFDLDRMEQELLN